MNTPDSHPLITIGITCFNAQDTIARAIESAVNQDWLYTEIIIVDDASDDESTQIIEGMMADLDHAQLIVHEKNKGPAGARQTILEHAKGAFIAFFDDDDKSDSVRLSRQYEAITAYEGQNNTDQVVCYASGVRLYDNDYKVDLEAIGSKGKIPVGEMLANYLLFFEKQPGIFYGSGTPTCSLMARTKTLKNAGGFDESFRRVEDVDLAVRIALQGGHFIGTKDKLFTQYATNAADKSPHKNLEAEQQLAEKHKDYLQAIGMYDYARQWPLLRYYHFKGRYGALFATLAKLCLRYPFKAPAHFLSTAPKRFFHERKMRRGRAA